MIKKLFLSFILLSLLSGCSGLDNNSPYEDSATLDGHRDIEQSNADSVSSSDKDVYTVLDSEDIFQIEIGKQYTAELLRDDAGRCFLVISTENSEKQKFPVEFYGAEEPIKILDLNLDGNMDIDISLYGTLNVEHQLFVWDSETENYVEVLYDGFSSLTYYEVYDGYLKTWGKESATEISLSILTWDGNILVLQSEDHISLENNKSR